MLVMLGIWKPGKKIKERKRAGAARRTGRCSRQSPVALAFSQAAASQSIFFGSLARRKDQWKQQQGERAGRKGNIEGPLVPLGLFLRPAARERCLVLGAWCLVLHIRPCPMGCQPRPPILSLGRCHTHPNPALGSGLALLSTLVDVSGAGQLSTGAPCREKVGGLLTNTPRREAR